MHEFIVIASFGSLPEAYMARNLLQGADIVCVLDNEHLAGLQRTFSPLPEIHLRVPAAEAEEAAALLAQAGLIPLPQGPVTRSGSRCPHCNGTHIRPTFGAIMRGLLAMLAAGPVRDVRYRCKDCGHTWQW